VVGRRIELTGAGRDTVAAALQAAGIACAPHPLSPTALDVTEGARRLRNDPHVLDGTVEHIVRSTVRLAKPLGDFTLGLDLTLGYIFNAMELRQPEALDEAHIFYPTAGNHRPLVIATIGGQWSYSAGSAGKGRNQ